MNFQTHRNRYLQRINRTQTTTEATPELSLYPHLQAFLEALCVDHFDKNTITFIQEPRQLNQIGRPDFIAMDGLLPIGYIEAERYGRDLDNLTGHAEAQNARFIENLDNFILTNFLDFQLWRDGQQHATANIANSPENLEALLDQFLNAGQIQITSPAVLAKYLARRTRELQTQIATTLTDEDSEIYGMFSAFRELLISTLTPDDFADMYAQTLAYGLFAARCNNSRTRPTSHDTPPLKHFRDQTRSSSNSFITSPPRHWRRISPTFWTTSQHFSAMFRQRCSARRLLRETTSKIR